MEDAIALQDAGCFCVVLESVPDRIASYITKLLEIPTIGIGAGAGTSGQVQVFHDLVGLFDKFIPKFSRRFANVGSEIHRALNDYHSEVKTGSFPASSNSFSIKDEQYNDFIQMMESRGWNLDKHSHQVKEDPENSEIDGLYGASSTLVVEEK